MEKLEKKESLVKNIWLAIKSLGTDYSSEEQDIEKQVAEIEKVQKLVHEEQINFGASLRVNPEQIGKGKTTRIKKEEKQVDREIGE